MKNYFRLGLLVLVFVAALAPASCGGSGSGGGSQDNGSGDNMGGMDHGGKAGETTGAMAGMDHGSMGSGEMAREMVMENGGYSDERFINAMVPHHQGAVDMAEVALRNAEHQEIHDLAEDIVVAQQGEIEELKAIKEQEFGTSEVPMEMSAADMEMMGMTDPKEQANKEPFDKAFIDAMIPHHRSAIEMAQVAYRESENPEIRALAETIVDAQTREIAQMQRWREEWYPES